MCYVGQCEKLKIDVMVNHEQVVYVELKVDFTMKITKFIPQFNVREINCFSVELSKSLQNHFMNSLLIFEYEVNYQKPIII